MKNFNLCNTSYNKFRYYILAALFAVIPQGIYAQVNVTLPSIEVIAGSPDINIPVVVDDITGRNILAYQFEIHYNKNLIYLLEVKTAGTISSGRFINANADTANGIITVACAGVDNMSGSGTLVNIVTRFKSEGISILTFRNSQNEEKFIFNDGNPQANTTDGSVTIGSPAKTLDLIYPDGGNVFTIGSADSVVWNSLNVAGLNIDLSTDNGINWNRLSDNYNAENKSYKFIVPDMASSQAKIRIRDASNSILSDESQTPFTIGSVTTADELINNPSQFRLYQNYPNPFNPVTEILYSIPGESFVSIKLYDITGNEISTLVNEVKQAGTHSVNLFGHNLSSGAYIYKMQAGNFSSSKKIMLLK